MTGIENP
ncbi:hypothetical protein MXB_1082 [Myxobolus squamalis]|nr:hypothetical protein MXB_1082 [Myxobolus squamalis]